VGGNEEESAAGASTARVIVSSVSREFLARMLAQEAAYHRVGAKLTRELRESLPSPVDPVLVAVYFARQEQQESIANSFDRMAARLAEDPDE
jgi:hypothetical protein